MQKPETRKEVYSEVDWSNSEILSAYEKSKIQAEKLAWDFVKNLPEDEKFELVVVNPTFI